MNLFLISLKYAAVSEVNIIQNRFMMVSVILSRFYFFFIIPLMEVASKLEFTEQLREISYFTNVYRSSLYHRFWISFQSLGMKVMEFNGLEGCTNAFANIVYIHKEKQAFCSALLAPASNILYLNMFVIV